MQSTTGITFNDVAGEDEAKELLTEIVDFLHNPQKYQEIGAVLQNRQKKKTHHIYQTIANMMCFIIMSKFLT